MLPKYYEEEFRVLSPDSTLERLLRPSAAMKYFQEVSDVHQYELGNGYQALFDRGMAFICARTSLNFPDAPKTNDRIICRSWLREVKSTQFIRDSVIMDHSGNVQVESTTSWVLMDLNERRILRPNKLDNITILTAPELALQNSRLGRIRLPEEMTNAGKRRVYYSMIDYFGHLNNCVYADLVCDFMPGGISGRQIRTLDIFFLNESVEGDELDIYTAEQDGTFYFRGIHERGVCFEAAATISGI